MARNSMNKGMAIAAVLALSLVAFSLMVPDAAYAATPFSLTAATGGAGFLKMAGALAALQVRRDDLRTQAEAKRSSIKPEMTPEAVAAIEAEHAALTEQLRSVNEEIATEEARLRDEQAETARRQQAEEATRSQTQPATTPANPGNVSDATHAERLRASTINTLGSSLGMDTLARTAVAEGVSVEEFRRRALDAMAARQADQPNVRTQVTVGGTQQVDAARAEAIANALLHRSDHAVALTEDGRRYRGLSLIEIARECVEARGISTRGMSRIELAGEALQVRGSGMMATSDFPNILASIANKTLRAGYEAMPQTFRPLVRIASVPDFKQVSRVQLGEAPQLEKVNEHGEFKRGSMGEAAEKYSVATYGKIVAITRQVLVNDDLSAFTRIPRAFGVQASMLESDLVWGIITGNPAMADGFALFHANHKNLGSAAAISVASVGAGRQAMRVQTGVDGKTLLNLSPTYIIAPVALETALDQFLSPIVPQQTSNAVPSALRKLIPITEPRLDAASATNWFMAADNAMIDTIELAYLEGAEGVYTETRQGFDVDGVEVKVRMDVGAKAIDWRGFYKNPV